MVFSTVWGGGGGGCLFFGGGLVLVLVFGPKPQHVEVPEPGIEPTPQQRPEPLQ